MVSRFFLSQRQSAFFGHSCGNFFSVYDADAGHELREHGGPRRALHAPLQHQHAHEVENDVQHRRHRQKHQRHHRVANGTQQVCEVVVQKGSRDPQKDDDEVLLHQGFELTRHPQHPQDAVQPQIHQRVQHQRDARDQAEREEHALAHPFFFPAAELHGDGRAAAHAQPQQDGGEEGHEGIGRAHRRQCVRAEEAAHHPGVRDVIHLLQKVAQHQRQGKE